MDCFIVIRAAWFIAMLVMELAFAALVIVSMLMIPVMISWLVIRPYGQEPQVDMALCLILLVALLKYPYDDIK